MRAYPERQSQEEKRKRCSYSRSRAFYSLQDHRVGKASPELEGGAAMCRRAQQRAGVAEVLHPSRGCQRRATKESDLCDPNPAAVREFRMCSRSADIAPELPACFPRSNQLSVASVQLVEWRQERRKAPQFGSYATGYPGKQDVGPGWLGWARAWGVLTLYCRASTSCGVPERGWGSGGCIHTPGRWANKPVGIVFADSRNRVQSAAIELCPPERAGGRSVCLYTYYCSLCQQKLVFDFIQVNPSRKPQPKELLSVHGTFL